MNYSAEKVRAQVGGSYEKAVKVFEMVSMVYRPVDTAPKKAWERAIKLINKNTHYMAHALCAECGYGQGINCNYPQGPTECPYIDQEA